MDALHINHTRATIRTLGEWMIVRAHQYYIANYQRKYEWGVTEVGILLQDILERRIPGLQNRDGINANAMAQNQIRQLFLSQIMLQQMGEQGNLTKYSVVDGQQRLVTIVIIYAVLQFCYHEIQNGGIGAERERATVAANDIKRRMVDGHNNSIIIRQFPNATNPQEPNRASNAYQPIRPEIFSFGYEGYIQALQQNDNRNQRQSYVGTDDLALILLSARSPGDNRLQNCSPAVKNAVKVRDWIRESRAAGGRDLNVSELDWLLEFQFALENMVYWTATVTASLDIAISSFRSLNSRYTNKPLQTKDVLKVLVSRVPNAGDQEAQMRASMAKIAIWSGVEESVDTFCNDAEQRNLDGRLWVGRLGSVNRMSQRPDSIMNQLCRIVATWKLNGYLTNADDILFPEFKRSCIKISNNELESLFLIDFRADHSDFQDFEMDMAEAWRIVSDIWRRRWTGRPQPRNRGGDALLRMAPGFVKTFELLEGIQSLHWQPLLVRFLMDFFRLEPWGEAQQRRPKRKKAHQETIDDRLYEVLCKLSLLVFSIEAGKDGTFLTRRGINAGMFNNMRSDIREHYTIDSDSVIVWWTALLNLYIQDAENADSAVGLLGNFDALISQALGHQNQFEVQFRRIHVFGRLNNRRPFPIYSHEPFQRQSVKKVLMQRLAICPLNHNHSFTKAVLYAIYDQTIDGADGADMSVEHLLPQSKVCNEDGLVDRRSGWYSTFQDEDGVVRARLLNMLGNFHLLPATNNAQLRDSGPREKATRMAGRNFYTRGLTYNQDRHNATIEFLNALASIGDNRALSRAEKTAQTIELYKTRHHTMLKSFSNRFCIYDDVEFDNMWSGEWGPGWRDRIYDEIENDVVIID
jgi:hypothetical protein